MGDSRIVLFDDPSRCCGCEACVLACPSGAIRMCPDARGFAYPVIADEQCTRCGSCVRACAFQAPPASNELQEVYVAASGITDIRRSASGGVFAALAERTLASGGVVAGAVLDFEDGHAVPRLVCIEDASGLDRLLGSKYVQCEQGAEAFAEILGHLKQGRSVTFGGTPCQVAALRKLARGCDERLLLADIVCHGVPNPRFFDSYLQHRASGLQAEIVGYSFRDKAYGWGFTGGMEFVRDGITHKLPIDGLSESYYRLFLEAMTYRESCYACPYASESRPGDLSIGDYWGIRDTHPELFEGEEAAFDDSLGVSSVIVNTSKGREYLQAHADDFIARPSTYEKAARRNKQLRQPVELPAEREELLNLYLDNGYEAVQQWFEHHFPNGDKAGS